MNGDQMGVITLIVALFAAFLGAIVGTIVGIIKKDRHSHYLFMGILIMVLSFGTAGVVGLAFEFMIKEVGLKDPLPAIVSSLALSLSILIFHVVWLARDRDHW